MARNIPAPDRKQRKYRGRIPSFAVVGLLSEVKTKQSESWQRDYHTVPHNVSPEPDSDHGIESVISCSLSQCSFNFDYSHPDSPIHLFVVYLCEHREDDAFYDLCRAFDIPDDVRVKIEANHSSLKLKCFDVLHRVYHHKGRVTLAMIMTKLSESNDELQQIISDYHSDK